MQEGSCDDGEGEERRLSVSHEYDREEHKSHCHRLPHEAEGDGKNEDAEEKDGPIAVVFEHEPYCDEHWCNQAQLNDEEIAEETLRGVSGHPEDGLNERAPRGVAACREEIRERIAAGLIE